MSSTAAGWLQFGLLFVALAACYIPLGNYIAHVFTTKKDWRVERFVYKLMGVDRSADQKWSTYIRSVVSGNSSSGKPLQNWPMKIAGRMRGPKISAAATAMPDGG